MRINLGLVVFVLCLRGARAKLVSRNLLFVSKSLMAALNSLGLSSDLRVMAASTKVCAKAYALILGVRLNGLVVYLVSDLRELVLLVFFFRGDKNFCCEGDCLLRGVLQCDDFFAKEVVWADAVCCKDVIVFCLSPGFVEVTEQVWLEV